MTDDRTAKTRKDDATGNAVTDLRNLRAQLIRAETIATGRLAAGAAYELEGPLSRMTVSLRGALAALFTGAEPELRVGLQEALQAAEQIEETVRGLRAFTEVEEAPHGVDVHEAIEIAIHFAQEEIGARAVLRRDYSPAPRARGSAAQLTRALAAILRNAAQSIPPAMPWANHIVVQTGATEDGRVAIEIADTGSGIEPDDLPFVFDPFFTTKPTERSPGLGLASARGAVIDLGGTITVESIVGRGSRFRIVLPAAEDAVEGGVLFASGLQPRARRVLCVSESPADARRLRQLLGEEGAHLVFSTAREAIERLALGEDYELVLCDASAAARSGFREELARLAPHALERTFELALRPHPSGTFAVPGGDERAAASGERGR